MQNRVWKWIFIYTEKRNHNTRGPLRFRTLSSKIFLENVTKMLLDGNQALPTHITTYTNLQSGQAPHELHQLRDKSASSFMHPFSRSCAPAKPRNEKWESSTIHRVVARVAPSITRRAENNQSQRMGVCLLSSGVSKKKVKLATFWCLTLLRGILPSCQSLHRNC